MIAYRRSKNIRIIDDIFRHKKAGKMPNQKAFLKLNDKRCATCKFTDNTDFVTFTTRR